MPSPAYTYTLTNGTTADASQVQQNFTDILNGVTDGTKDLSVNALTVAGTATLNGDINLGNASADTITITGTIGNVVPLPGVTDASSAAAGKIGQVIQLAVSASTNFGTSATFADFGASSISLTAGDWDVYFAINATTGGSDALIQVGVTTTSGNSTTGLDASTGNVGNASLRNADGQVTASCFTRINISTTTVYYGKVSFSGASVPTYKGILRARRVR